MARKPQARTVADNEPAKLTKPRDTVRSQLVSRIDLGAQIANQPVLEASAFEQQESEFAKWDDYNNELLTRCFSNLDYAKKYDMDFELLPMSGIGGPPPFADKVRRQRERIIRKVEHIKSLAERLDLIDEVGDLQNDPVSKLSPSRAVPHTDNRNVFIVHGHDASAKQIVARFLEKCALNPIILHDLPNGGRTIIEKFEQQADVGFAIVLLTPDDTGAAKPENPAESPKLQDRARQNVILELGYFVGRLTRARVAALKKGNLELPTDFAGVVWTDMDPADAWKMSLARELKNSGYDIDLNAAFA